MKLAPLSCGDSRSLADREVHRHAFSLARIDLHRLLLGAHLAHEFIHIPTVDCQFIHERTRSIKRARFASRPLILTQGIEIFVRPYPFYCGIPLYSLSSPFPLIPPYSKQPHSQRGLFEGRNQSP